MIEDDDLVRCEHCKKLFLWCEIEELSPERCSILRDEEIYYICEYCIGANEGTGEVEYWNEWVRKKRLENEQS
ncbi:hypothetical protein [Brevibacillus sedimenti]|jgi:hypothetical protein|uniref:hypothetical protein n=1 Tax=Brevibacillus sedimenti TaxID=2613334 RepID=UPI000E365C1D|nr:hypothetical protein [Anoxybacillus sediminis]REK64107.1 MAG: hypothetical protein DF221_08355 [Brevibacillus sp.]UFJ60727.1 hypothetical protein IRT44_15895 [Anoxybacillus sediminis]